MRYLSKNHLDICALCFYEGGFTEERSNFSLVTWCHRNLLGYTYSIFLYHILHLWVLHINQVWNGFSKHILQKNLVPKDKVGNFWRKRKMLDLEENIFDYYKRTSWMIEGDMFIYLYFPVFKKIYIHTISFSKLQKKCILAKSC